jgi:hypothetical protein
MSFNFLLVIGSVPKQGPSGPAGPYRQSTLPPVRSQRRRQIAPERGRGDRLGQVAIRSGLADGRGARIDF